MALVNGIEKVTKSEGFDLDRLKAVVKTFNEAGLVEKKIKVVAVKTEVMATGFMTAVEAVPEDREKDIPKEVLALYNAYADVIDDKAKDLMGIGEKQSGGAVAKASVGKKASGEKKFRKYSSVEVMKQLLKDGASDDEILRVFEEKYTGKGTVDKNFILKRIKIYKKLAS